MTSEDKVIINLIQDVPTPHNNVLIGAFLRREDVKIKLWYAKNQDLDQYQWSRDISQEHCPAVLYGTCLDISFLRYCLAHSDERFVIVGWSNVNTQLLHLLFFLFRRPFNHWTDFPNPTKEGQSISRRVIRFIAYKLLRYSRSKVFGVGKATVDLFHTWGFPEERVENMPIFVTVNEDLLAYRCRKLEIRSRYDVPSDGFLLSAGSRLIFEKGYDLLIDAIAQISPAVRCKIRLIIAGNGVEFGRLQTQIDSLDLAENVRLVGWMDNQEFKAVIANSDIFIHPARFDAYGGTVFGMALSVPVIGSTGAGSAVDRIEHGKNGFLYAPTDIEALASYITRLLQDPELRQRIGEAGWQTALQWQPDQGVDILLHHSI